VLGMFLASGVFHECTTLTMGGGWDSRVPLLPLAGWLSSRRAHLEEGDGTSCGCVPRSVVGLLWHRYSWSACILRSSSSPSTSAPSRKPRLMSASHRHVCTFHRKAPGYLDTAPKRSHFTSRPVPLSSRTHTHTLPPIPGFP
jgi:hypothetical protein